MTSRFGLKTIFFDTFRPRIILFLRSFLLKVDEVEQLAIIRWDACVNSLTIIMRLLVKSFSDRVEILLDEGGKLIFCAEDAAPLSKLSVF